MKDRECWEEREVAEERNAEQQGDCNKEGRPKEAHTLQSMETGKRVESEDMTGEEEKTLVILP